MPQVSTKTLEKIGYTDAKGACELLGWGYHGRNLAKLKKSVFVEWKDREGRSSTIKRGQKVGYHINLLQKYRQEVIDNPKAKTA